MLVYGGYHTYSKCNTINYYIICAANFPGTSFPSGEFSTRRIFPAANFPGSEFSRGEFSRGEFLARRIFPRRIFPRQIFPRRIFLEPYSAGSTIPNNEQKEDHEETILRNYILGHCILLRDSFTVGIFL